MGQPAGHARGDRSVSKDLTGKGPETVLTHAGRDPQAHFGAVNTPVFHASTILSPSYADRKREKGPREPRYGRRGTPTVFTLEDVLAEIEGADAAVICPSGLSAITTAILAFVNQGDHVLMVDCVYGPARNFATKILPRYGVSTTFFDPAIGNDIAGLIQDNTKVVYLEAPGSQTFEMQDVPAIAAAARARGCKVLIDNTWATGLLFKPFAHGCDVSVHAATKYIVGHSDVMMGAITTTAEAYAPVREMWDLLGHSVGPDDVYLATRGVRTMAVRLAQHQKNAVSVAEWLQGRPEVARVLYPALESDPGHALWKRDFTGASGLFGVVLKPASDGRLEAFFDALSLFGMGSSWGGYESLAIPADPAGYRTATQWSPEGPLIRLHIGLEAPADLIADLEAGFAAMQRVS
ncbi:MAG: cystathionine beta-lyase [Alphaproteobacteria bacterium]|nr:cystathionine beta-lyase [Alphaproteobacteria bacterium]MCB9929910.1 cystathionine beta-lyase [Alphaproteobacteria bacterium]